MTRQINTDNPHDIVFQMAGDMNNQLEFLGWADQMYTAGVYTMSPEELQAVRREILFDGIADGDVDSCEDIISMEATEVYEHAADICFPDWYLELMIARIHLEGCPIPLHYRFYGLEWIFRDRVQDMLNADAKMRIMPISVPGRVISRQDDDLFVVRGR